MDRVVVFSSYQRKSTLSLVLFVVIFPSYFLNSWLLCSFVPWTLDFLSIKINDRVYILTVNFLNFLMMASTLVRRPCLNEARHLLKYLCLSPLFVDSNDISIIVEKLNIQTCLFSRPFPTVPSRVDPNTFFLVFLFSRFSGHLVI